MNWIFFLNEGKWAQPPIWNISTFLGLFLDPLYNISLTFFRDASHSFVCNLWRSTRGANRPRRLTIRGKVLDIYVQKLIGDENISSFWLSVQRIQFIFGLLLQVRFVIGTTVFSKNYWSCYLLSLLLRSLGCKKTRANKRTFPGWILAFYNLIHFWCEFIIYNLWK